MAERPRYRPLGVSIPSMPNIDYVGTAQAKAGVFDTVANALDKMSEFAFEKQAAKAKREGEQWAFDQQLSYEQIQTAMSKGRSLDEIIGSADTVFGSVSRATIGAQLRTELEGEARLKLSEYSALLNADAPIDVPLMIKDLKGLVAGHSDLLGDIDPSEANSYSATVNTLTAPVYKLALENNLKLRQAGVKINANTLMGGFSKELETLLQSNVDGIIYDESGQPISDTEAQIAVLQKAMFDALVPTNDPEYITEQTKVIEEKTKQARLDVLTQYVLSEDFAQNDSVTMNKVRQGLFDRHQNLYDGLAAQEQVKLRISIREELNSRANRQKIETDAINAGIAKDVAGTSNDYMNSVPGSEAEADALFLLQKAAEATGGQVINISTINGMVSAKNTQTDNEGKYQKSDPMPEQELQLEKEIQQDLITNINDLVRRGKELGLPIDRILTFTNKVNKTTTPIEQRVNKTANQVAKILDTPGYRPTQEQAIIRSKFISDVDLAYNEELEIWQSSPEETRGAPPQKDLIAKELIQTRLDSQEQKRIDKEILLLNTNFGANGIKPTNYNFDETTLSTILEELNDSTVASGLGLSNTELTGIRSAIQNIINLIEARDR